MKNSILMESQATHLSAQVGFLPRSGQSRTNSTVKGAPQGKTELSAKKLAVSGAPHQRRPAGVLPAEVEVNAFYFANGKAFKSFPRVITFEHKQYNFRDGLQMLVQKGQDVVRFFDMTDGFNNYRLRQEQDQWFLVSLRPVTR